MRRTFTKHWAYKYICLSTNCQFWFISYYVFKIIKHQKCKMCLQCVEITSMYCKWFVLHPVAVFHHHHHRRRFQVIWEAVYKALTTTTIIDLLFCIRVICKSTTSRKWILFYAFNLTNILFEMLTVISTES